MISLLSLRKMNLVTDKVLIKALKQANGNIPLAIRNVELKSTSSTYNRCYQLLEGHKREIFNYL